MNELQFQDFLTNHFVIIYTYNRIGCILARVHTIKNPHG